MNVTTIAAADVPLAATRLPAFEVDAAVRSLLVAPVEAMILPQAPFVGRTDLHPLVQAAYLAFTERCPLVLSPDVVWFCLARGFTLHVASQEALRREIVGADHDFELELDRPDFTIGGTNPWHAVFQDLSSQLFARAGKLWELTGAHVSTTGPLERLASELSVATSLAPHFTWEPPFPGDRVVTGPGIPRIHLLGTPDDWRQIRQRAASFTPFGLEAWTRALLPVLDRIVDAAEGRSDVEFWRAFFRYEHGADELTGWLLVLFPYLRAVRGDRFVPNLHLDTWLASWRAAEARQNPVEALGKPEGPGLAQMPPGLVSAAFRFVDSGRREHVLDLVAGLIGVTQDPDTLALSPEFVWALVHPDGVV
ncbi:DUF4419 domain-containing protein [Chondromyces apiculatus]|uniref:DUF4419 domain-containing protein n=1 Tax=Chondromyces apiculatus DSM 436 TaxID=1192034 RepID=A0A017T1M1_9BACT|nr:DUF4419 domain-containing protein [Chondromyces apiculatus]EYF03149.1 Hypothetical protein CAP_6125 [Chondromyces apiculatus DSM 436]